MKKIHLLSLFLMIWLVFSFSACSASPTSTSDSSSPQIGKVIQVDQGSYIDISVPEFQKMIENKDFTLVNVHIPFEGDLPKTDLSIAYDTIGQNLDQLPGDRTEKIVLYCRSDRMSNIAAQELVRLGYTNIWNLDGGMVAWEQAGLPIER